MKLSLQRLVEVEARLSGRVMALDSRGLFDRAELIDVARCRVQRVRERRLAEQARRDDESEAA